jgi:shikimate kinase
MTARSGPVVVLVGPPGSGKTSVGGALARLTGRGFRDTDIDIEATAGRPIPDIFITDGEPVFRAMERAAVATALTEHDGVLALGGGSILAEQTRELLVRHSVVFLSLTMPTGVKRTGLASNRPLLTGVNPRATYKALLDARLPLYEQVATIVVQTDDLTVDEVAAVIIDKLGLG